MSRSATLRVCACIVVLAGLACALPLGGPTATPSPSPTPAATPTPIAVPRTAQLSEINNSVVARGTSEQPWAEAGVGETLNVSGGVRTGPDSRVRIDTSEGTILRIAADTEFELLEFPPDVKDPVTRLKLEAGKIWVVLTKLLGDGTFEVETPSGVATVRGSLLSVEQAPGNGRVVVTCLEGACGLRNPQSGADVDLAAGQQSSIAAPGQDPAPPQPMDAAQYQDWLQNVPEALNAVQQALSRPTPTPPSGNSTGATGQITTPRLAVDGQGVLHLAYASTSARATGDYFHQQLQPDGTWSAPEPLTADFAFLYGSLALLPRADGALCALWNGATTGSDTIGYYRRCLVDDAWTAPEPLALIAGTARDFWAAAAPDGQLRAIYVTDAGTVRWVSRDLNAAEDQIDDPRLSGEALAVQARLAIDAQGRDHVAWVQFGQAAGEPLTVRYHSSTDGGQTWAEAEPLSTDAEQPDGLGLQLVADVQGNVHLIWQGNAISYRRWSPQGGWGATVNVSGETNGVGAQLAVTSDGLARVVWSRSGAVYYAAQSPDGAWSPPSAIAGTNSFDLALAVDAQGRAHLAWTDGEQVLYTLAP